MTILLTNLSPCPRLPGAGRLSSATNRHEWGTPIGLLAA